MGLDSDGVVDIGGTRDGSHRRARRRVPARHIVEVDGLHCTDGLLTLLDLAGVLGSTLTVEYATNRSNWVPFAVLTNTNAFQHFTLPVTNDGLWGHFFRSRFN